MDWSHRAREQGPARKDAGFLEASDYLSNPSIDGFFITR